MYTYVFMARSLLIAFVGLVPIAWRCGSVEYNFSSMYSSNKIHRIAPQYYDAGFLFISVQVSTKVRQLSRGILSLSGIIHFFRFCSTYFVNMTAVLTTLKDSRFS